MNLWAEHSTTGTTLIQMIPWSNIGSCQKLRICMHPALSILVSPHYEFYWGWKKHKKTKKKRWVTNGTMVVFWIFYSRNFHGSQKKKKNEKKMADSVKLSFSIPLILNIFRKNWCEGHWCGSTCMVVRLSDKSSKMGLKHKKCIFSLF